MDCDAYERALLELGVNPQSACDGIKDGMPAPFHKAGNFFVQIYPGSVLSEAQRQAFVDELTNYLTARRTAKPASQSTE